MDFRGDRSSSRPAALALFLAGFAWLAAPAAAQPVSDAARADYELAARWNSAYTDALGHCLTASSEPYQALQSAMSARVVGPRFQAQMKLSIEESLKDYGRCRAALVALDTPTFSGLPTDSEFQPVRMISYALSMHDVLRSLTLEFPTILKAISTGNAVQFEALVGKNMKNMVLLFGTQSKMTQARSAVIDPALSERDMLAAVDGYFRTAARIYRAHPLMGKPRLDLALATELDGLAAELNEHMRSGVAKLDRELGFVMARQAESQAAGDENGVLVASRMIAATELSRPAFTEGANLATAIKARAVRYRKLAFSVNEFNAMVQELTTIMGRIAAARQRAAAAAAGLQRVES